MQFVYAISPMQSKVARTYLEWSQGDLANAANVSLSTISSFENGLSPRIGSVKQIRKALENAGIEFADGDSVKRRDNEAKLYRGFGSCELFYNDLLQTAKAQGEDIYCIVKSHDMLMRAFGIADYDDLKSMEMLSDVADVKCLLTENFDPTFLVPSFEYRTTTNYQAAPSSYFGFGNKYAYAVQEGRTNFIFAVFHIPVAAQEYRSHFLSLWSSASQLRVRAPRAKLVVSV